MSIGYVGKAFVMNTVAGTTAQVPMPSTVADGHKLYVVVGSIGSTTGTMSGPAGWTKVAEDTAGSSLRAAIYVKNAVNADAGATYTWTFPNAGRTFGYAAAYSGVDLSAANLAQTAVSTTEGPGPWATPSLALGTGDWYLYAGVGRENPGSTGTHDWTSSGSSDTERYDLFSNVGTTSIAIAAALWDTGAPVTAGSQARSVSSNVAYSQTVMLAARIPAAADTGSSAGGNPWTQTGLAQR